MLISVLFFVSNGNVNLSIYQAIDFLGIITFGKSTIIRLYHWIFDGTRNTRDYYILLFPWRKDSWLCQVRIGCLHWYFWVAFMEGSVNFLIWPTPNVYSLELLCLKYNCVYDVCVWVYRCMFMQADHHTCWSLVCT